MFIIIHQWPKNEQRSAHGKGHRLRLHGGEHAWARFLEKVYENALAHELRKAGLGVEQQNLMTVVYDGAPVGDYFADICVNGTLVVELKAVKELNDTHLAQCLNYLKATGLKTALLLNFGAPRIQIKRVSL